MARRWAILLGMAAAGVVALGAQPVDSDPPDRALRKLDTLRAPPGDPLQRPPHPPTPTPYVDIATETFAP